jgi:hypothetical protein
MAQRVFINSTMSKALINSMLFAIIVANAIYFLTPLLAMSFYELYHLVKIDFIYTIYTAVKFISAYFMLWQWRGITATAIGGSVGLIMYWYKVKN